jgi:N-hydroxyarylamine O-acetyltransferase
MNALFAETTLDPRGYFDRINLARPRDDDSSEPSLATLRRLHEAHMLAVPFENLSIHYGQPIILETAALYDKIVQRRRGGFCYELNGLFAWLLRQLGFDVTMLSAEVAGSDGAFSPPYDHLTLLVRQVDGADWLADVGFGDSFRQPLRFQADVEQDGADGRVYRLRESPHPSDEPGQRPQFPYWLMEQRGAAPDEQWEPAYRFTLQSHELADFEARCLYQQNAPDSHFRQKRVCSLALPEGRLTLSDLRLITTIHGKREERDLPSEEQYRETLARRFGVVL